MKTIFAELYNRILELFQIEKSENTSECAANRLQVILMHDRTKLDPLIMSSMREELIAVFSKYVVIDKEKLEIDLKNEGDAAALMLNIPIVRAKTEDELNELRKQLEKDEQKVTDDEDIAEADYIIVEEPEDEASSASSDASDASDVSDKIQTAQNLEDIENISDAAEDAAESASDAVSEGKMPNQAL